MTTKTLSETVQNVFSKSSKTRAQTLKTFYNWLKRNLNLNDEIDCEQVKILKQFCKKVLVENDVSDYTSSKKYIKRIARFVLKLLRDELKINVNDIDCLLRIVDDIPPNLRQFFDDDNTKQFIIDFRDWLKQRKYKRISNILGQVKQYILPNKNIFFNATVDRNFIIDFIQNIENNVCVEFKTRNASVTSKTLSPQTQQSIKFFNILIDSKLVQSLNDCEKINQKEIISKDKNILFQEKDYFDDEELDKMKLQYSDCREKLICMLFLSSGIRIGGLLNLQVKGIFDEQLNVLEYGTTLEVKGDKIRKFPIYEPLKQAIQEYRDDARYHALLCDPNNAVFPEYSQKIGFWIPSTKSCAKETISKVLHDVCDRSGIPRQKAHAHAFRKTVVTKLMQSGNTLDHVSKFIGHTSSAITAKYYWNPTQEDLIQDMNVAFLQGIKTNHFQNDCVSVMYSASTMTSDQVDYEKIRDIYLKYCLLQKKMEYIEGILTQDQINKLKQQWTEKDDFLAMYRANKLVKQTIMDCDSDDSSETSSMQCD